MRAYYVNRDGYVREGEVFDDPPVIVTIAGITYLYRDRMDDVAIYEEDETPTT